MMAKRKSTVSSKATDSTPAPMPLIKPKPTQQRTARREPAASLTVSSTVERTVYTRAEAARYLATSPVTLWRIGQLGQDSRGQQLGHTVIGARVRFLREDLDRYARGERPRPGAIVGWAKDEDRAERMRQQHAAKKAKR